MSVYSDRQLQQSTHVEIERPVGEVAYQPSSVDLHLGDEFGQYEQSGEVIDVRDHRTYPNYHTVTGDSYRLDPFEFILGHTQERVTLDDGLIGFLWGRSSVGRLGLFVHNAGLIDAGFDGELTLELFNASQNPIRVHSGMRIVQMTVHELDEETLEEYGMKDDEKYQGQDGATPSKLYNDSYHPFDD